MIKQQTKYQQKTNKKSQKLIGSGHYTRRKQSKIKRNKYTKRKERISSNNVTGERNVGKTQMTPRGMKHEAVMHKKE